MNYWIFNFYYKNIAHHWSGQWHILQFHINLIFIIIIIIAFLCSILFRKRFFQLSEVCRFFLNISFSIQMKFYILYQSSNRAAWRLTSIFSTNQHTRLDISNESLIILLTNTIGNPICFDEKIKILITPYTQQFYHNDLSLS